MNSRSPLLAGPGRVTCAGRDQCASLLARRSGIEDPSGTPPAQAVMVRGATLTS